MLPRKLEEGAVKYLQLLFSPAQKFGQRRTVCMGCKTKQYISQFVTIFNNPHSWAEQCTIEATINHFVNWEFKKGVLAIPNCK